MPFRLKNTGMAYQKFVNAMVEVNLRKLIEVCTDDMVVKSSQAKRHLQDLQALFTRLAEYNLYLNPVKCTFGLQRGRILGYLRMQRWIEANIDQVRGIAKLPSPRIKKEIQQLT